jgi:hypothetical protein
LFENDTARTVTKQAKITFAMTQKNPLKQRHKTRQLGEVANCVKLKQVAPVTEEEADETVVITVYTFSFDGGCNENGLRLRG